MNVMKNFISEIKKVETDRLIYSLSRISIDMFKNNKCEIEVPIPVLRYGKRQNLIVNLFAWDIPNIAFLSVKESNDYRHSDKMVSLGQLINLYREYENDHSAARGKMAVRELIVFKHSKELGDCPAYKLFDAVEVKKNEGVEYPRKYQDYTVQIHDEKIPDSVEVKRMI